MPKFVVVYFRSSNETFYFSVLLALTSVFPCLLMVGPTVETWISKR